MNYIFSDFLSKLSPEFRAKVGKDVSPKWPVGAAFSRCQDLLASAAKMSGAIGYAELRCGEGSGLPIRSEEHTSELQSRLHLVCRLLLETTNNSLPTRPRAGSSRRRWRPSAR